MTVFKKQPILKRCCFHARSNPGFFLCPVSGGEYHASEKGLWKVNVTQMEF